MANKLLKGATVIMTFPGIGNVGSIAANYMLKSTKSKHIQNIYSRYMPAVLINNGDGNFKLPKVAGSIIRGNKKKIVVYIGDTQPPTETGVYKLSRRLIDDLAKNGANELIILGGIGLEMEPEEPKTYFITNNKSISKELKRSGIDGAASSKVSVVLGASGVLFGIAEERKLKASIILAETCGAPGYVGLNATKKLIEVLSKYLGLKIDTKNIKTAISSIKQESLAVEVGDKTDTMPRHYIG